VSRRLANERGSALVVAVIAAGLMLALGLSAYAYVDGQSRQAAQERHREAAFNQGDAVLSAQGFVLSRYWPAAATGAYPDCAWNGTALTASGAATSAQRCPSPAAVTQTYAGADYAMGTRWSTIVRDNGGSSATFYDDAVTTAQPSWDANGDGEVWVRASSSLRAARRTVVARLRVDRRQVVLPKNVLTAGTVAISGGPKPYIVQNGSTLALRCPSASSSGCYASSKPNQVKGPGQITFNYPSSHSIPPSDLDRLRQTAIANGTYYANGCPPSPVGALVFVESGTCAYAGNGTWNSAAAPGMFVVVSGTMTWTGNAYFYGTVYMYNAQNATCPVFEAGGTATVYGAVFIDGPGCFNLRGNTQIVYEANAVRAVSYYASVSQVRNSFRELN
jgi:hypothetical protein